MAIGNLGLDNIANWSESPFSEAKETTAPGDNNPFAGVEETKEDKPAQENAVPPVNTGAQEETKEVKPAEVDIDGESVFSNQGKPESVSSEDKTDKETQEGTNNQLPPDKNLFTSIAGALYEDGVFPGLDSEKIASVKDADDFTELIKAQIQAGLTDAQKDIQAALEGGVSADDIRLYHNTMSALDNMSDENIKAETTDGANLRQNLIYQDYINKGFSEERAMKELKRSVDAGDDIADALEAKQSLSKFYRTQYNGILEASKQREQAAQAARQKDEDDLKKSMLDDEEVFKGIKVDKNIRQKAYTSITKPIYKDEEGRYYTAVQKYQKDNPVDFRKKLGVIYTLTDGFQNMDKIISGPVRRAYNSKMKALEGKFNNMPTNADGSYTFVGDNSPETKATGWQLDI